jgi:hypothetical protein
MTPDLNPQPRLKKTSNKTSGRQTETWLAARKADIGMRFR